MSATIQYYITAEINFIVSDQDIDDIMSAALEGGITHWCSRAEVIDKYLGEYASEQIARGGSLLLHDREENSVYELTLSKFLTGLRLWFENNRNIPFTNAGRLEVCDIDAAAADSIIQYALFHDVIFG